MRWILAGAGMLFLWITVPIMAVTLLITVVIAPTIKQQQDEAACTPAGGMVPSGPWRVPVQQAYALTSGFGMRLDPAYHRWQLHDGQDIATLPGPGPIVAASVGTVIQVGWAGGYGNAVTLQHAGGVTTRYGHMSAIAPGITMGATVKIGQQLGTEGSTGASTGNHLHFLIHVNGKPTDPVPFMAAHGAPLNGRPVAPSPQTGTPPTSAAPTAPAAQAGFALPAPGTPRKDSLHNSPLPIPDAIKTLYQQAAARYHLPWTLLAGVGMEETGHGRNTGVSTAGAQGLMQFMPATFALHAVDGDSDGQTQITNPADSIFTAARYLQASGATASGGPAGVRKALFAYNHADWYVNDVLAYAQAYGGGTVTGCATAPTPQPPAAPPVAAER